jgi:multiple antibiotic resistance protein
MLFALVMAMDGGHDEEKEHEPKALSSEIAVLPLAMPMMTTPQGLVAITFIVAAQHSVLNLVVVIASILAIMALNLLCLLSADRIIRIVCPSALRVIAKVAGLVLTALASQLTILGFRDLGVICRSCRRGALIDRMSQQGTELWPRTEALGAGSGSL